MRLLRRARAIWFLPALALATRMVWPLAVGDHSTSGDLKKQPESPELARIIDSIIAGEKLYVTKLKEYSPRVETYVQRYEYDTELGEVPKEDAYFLGRLTVETKAKEVSFIRDPNSRRSRRRPLQSEEHLPLDQFLSLIHI